MPKKKTPPKKLPSKVVFFADFKAKKAAYRENCCENEAMKSILERAAKINW